MSQDPISEESKRNRAAVRKAGKEQRKALLPTERTEKSAVISEKLFASGEYKNARTVMLYKATESEVCLEQLERLNAECGNAKTFAYPRCVSADRMEALIPCGAGAWRQGLHGITEPDPERSVLCPPEKIDLIICPCTAFDENLGRTGMGAGYYDRFLERCPKARAVAVAFECQKAENTFPAEWDKPMQAVFTEEKIRRI